ncbi:hypothetical protein F7P69_17555 [Cellulosimicrobium funkei]|nr:hypothetical protein [Cellulosimicrobium funkei]
MDVTQETDGCGGPEDRSHPGGLDKVVFTAAEARAAGMTDYQLRHPGLVTATRGIRFWDVGERPWAQMVQAVSSLPGDHYLSHSTAARLWGLWMPASLEEDLPIHITGRKGTAGSRRRPGIVGHKAKLHPSDVVEVDGHRLTTPERTWLDLATQIHDPLRLVAAGDALLQRQDGPLRGIEVLGRLHPLATLADIDAAMARRRRTKGINAARHARALIRAGVDSAAETRVRMIIFQAGLPEPVVNQEVWLSPTLKRRPDLHYPGWRIAIQYDGRHHGENTQLNSDIHRDSDFTDHGWESVKAADDIYTARGEQLFLERLRRAILRQTSGDRP